MSQRIVDSARSLSRPSAPVWLGAFLASTLILTGCSEGSAAHAVGSKSGNAFGHCNEQGQGHDKDNGTRVGHDRYDENCGNGGGNGGGNGNEGSASIRVLSNRADLISGDDALVEVVLERGARFDDLKVTLNGSDVTSQFAQRPNGRVMAQLTGLVVGENTLSALLGGEATHTVAITNHPNGGPVFSGPRPEPWTCGNGGVAIDADCNQPAEYAFFYKSTDPNKPGLSNYDPGNPPDDVAMTTTQNGQTVPFIVRREKGYQLRDQYYIFQLFDPAQGWEPWAPQATWNHKLLITHGGSCGTTNRSGTPPLDDYAGTIPPNPAIEQSYVAALGLGFAVGSTALDNLGHNCNLVTAAESLIMMKERLVEEYGELRYTLGSGCSGGSITQQQIANSYPGVYQGLITTCSYPDVFGTAIQFAEYHILRNYFEQPNKWSVPWTPAQFADVEGHATHLNAVLADEAFFKGATDPSNCKGADASADAYDANSNPGGVRCGVVDYMINLFGPRRSDVWSPNEQLLGRGFGGLPVDNVGVQYGLRALQLGKIDANQFIDLNRKVGSVDIDINPIPERLVGDPDALARVYRTGAINIGTHMDKVPVIDGRGPDPGAAHDAVHVYMMRARLDREHGHHDNHVIWEGPAALIGDPYFLLNALEGMDRWVAAIEADASSKPLAKKVVDNKPADIGDACYNGSGVKLTDGICGEAVVPTYGTPRIVAGEGTLPLVGNKGIPADTAKCQLMPLDSLDPTPALGDYGPLGLTASQWQAMHQIFPDGVCDFSKPGVGYTDAVAWMTYQEANGDVIYGGTPMPPAPDYSGDGVASPSFGVFR